MRDETGTRLIDWVDHLAVGDEARWRFGWANTVSSPRRGDRHRCGRTHEGFFRGSCRWPVLFAGWRRRSNRPLILSSRRGSRNRSASRGRRSGRCAARVAVENNSELWVVERHGHAGFEMPELAAMRAAGRRAARRGVSPPASPVRPTGRGFRACLATDPRGGAGTRRRSDVRSVLRHRGRILAPPQPGGPSAEGPPGRAGTRLGQSRPSHRIAPAASISAA